MDISQRPCPKCADPMHLYATGEHDIVAFCLTCYIAVLVPEASDQPGGKQQVVDGDATRFVRAGSRTTTASRPSNQ